MEIHQINYTLLCVMFTIASTYYMNFNAITVHARIFIFCIMRKMMQWYTNLAKWFAFLTVHRPACCSCQCLCHSSESKLSHRILECPRGGGCNWLCHLPAGATKLLKWCIALKESTILVKKTVQFIASLTMQPLLSNKHAIKAMYK